MSCLQMLFLWVWIIVLWVVSILTDPIVIFTEYAL